MPNRIRRRLPSPAFVIALVALFVALGGGAYAAVTGSVTTREILNGTIRNVDFKDGTLRGQEFKRDSLGGSAIKEQALDGTRLPEVAAAARARAADQATGLALQVAVRADGTRGAARGVVSTAKLDTGRYQVIFDRDVSACLYATTLVQVAPARADVTGQIAVAPIADNANGVRIATADAAGAAADRGFHLLVSC
jgi:hypothetical protein